MKILVTGGVGYIASHVIADLVEHFVVNKKRGIKIVSVDNFHNSYPKMLQNIKLVLHELMSKLPESERISPDDLFNNYEVSITNRDQLDLVMEKEKPEVVIHFAACKYVEESVQKPSLYYHTNVVGTSNLLESCVKFGVSLFIFSSSCAVYGDVPMEYLPVKEDTPWFKPTSPYHHSKQVCEKMIEWFSEKYGIKSVSLRYFNPAGSHPSYLIGDFPKRKAQNIFPALMRVVLGLEKHFLINGNDYPTRDGTCIRDYIHVCDLAKAHTLALKHGLFMNNGYEVFNLGTQCGYSVKEIFEATQDVLGIKIPYIIGKRRPGDASALYADNQKAKKILGWTLNYSLEDIIKSSYRFYTYMLNTFNKKAF